MRFLFVLMMLSGLFTATAPVLAHAAQQNASAGDDIDLILPPVLASKDAPFYRGASVKMGDKVIPVTEAATTNGQLVEFQPANNRVVVSNAASASESDKGEALLNTVTAMQASAIATAAGQ